MTQRNLATRLGAAAALALVPGAAHSAEWYLLLDRLGYIYFADNGSMTRTGDIVEVEFLQGNLDSPPPGESAMLRYKVDCAAKTLHLQGGRYFTDDGTRIADLSLPGGPQPVRVETVSPGDHFFDFACKSGYRTNAVSDPFAELRAARVRG